MNVFLLFVFWLFCKAADMTQHQLYIYILPLKCVAFLFEQVSLVKNSCCETKQKKSRLHHKQFYLNTETIKAEIICFYVSPEGSTDNRNRMSDITLFIPADYSFIFPPHFKEHKILNSVPLPLLYCTQLYTVCLV